MKQFSLDSMICVDCTHRTNGYNFNLITIIVVDEYGEGYPVAWCVSNREDQVILQVFYNSIKKNSWNALAQIFYVRLGRTVLFSLDSSIIQHRPPNKLICTWHVDCAWRENLKKFTNNELKVTLYHNLICSTTRRD